MAASPNESEQVRGKKGLIVLVPGTFNSLLPGTVRHDMVRKVWEVHPYYSENIIQTIESLGYVVYVVKRLHSAGSFERNGGLTFRQLRKWYQANYPDGNLPITMIGHSAGGLYALFAAHLNHSLPIKRVVLMASPISGLALANSYFSIPILGDLSEVVINYASSLLDLRGLPQMRSERVKQFLQSLRLDTQTRVFAVGLTQAESKGYESRKNADYLCLACRLTALLIDEPSDGIIGISSAYGVQAKTFNRNGEEVWFHRLVKQHGFLDHSEQTMDSRIFEFFGVKNAGFIRQEQNRFFRSLLVGLNRLPAVLPTVKPVQQLPR